MDLYRLPKAVTIGGLEYQINTDYRDILEIIGYLNDPKWPEILRWQIVLELFYDGDIPKELKAEAIQFLSDFISYDNKASKPGMKLMDWEQDAQMIISDVNKVAGKEVRELPYLHWWTFLSYFYGIGEGQLSTIVSIRKKKMTGKKLEKWEDEFYRENREMIDFRREQTTEEIAMQEYFSKWL